MVTGNNTQSLYILGQTLKRNKNIFFNVNIYVVLVKRTDPAGLFAADLIRFDALRLLQALGRMSFLATTKAP